jgi:carboxypeptidase C (cathepsin A)
MKIIHLALSLTLLLAGCGGGGGGGSSPPVVVPPASTFTDSTVYSSAPTASLTTPNEITAVTRHQLALGGATLNYTATAGHLTALQLGNGAPQASFFYVAYTVDGAAPAPRRYGCTSGPSARAAS